MENFAVKVEDLSKVYKIGNRSGFSFRDTINNKLNKLLHSKESEPYTEHWALKKVNFEINKGDRIGIIGKNGAGKSTLLKVLSKVTKPTEGKISIDGKIASLLEVGTGFHPELTGKENIFMNGAILGMKQAEIKKNFDEIVSFSGVEKFINTPVKRYSSGMYVRLAFAVAAHLESDILIVDEVLAVGDAEFQKKCLGKMRTVSSDGRTVLFVSHNMGTISSLCEKVLFLENGQIKFLGEKEEGIKNYLLAGNTEKGIAFLNERKSRMGNAEFSRFKQIETLNNSGQRNSSFRIGDEMNVKLTFVLDKKINNLEIGFTLLNPIGITYGGFISIWEGFDARFEAGTHSVICKIPALQIMPGTYSITTWLKRQNEYIDDEVENALEFEVIGNDITGFNPCFEIYNHIGFFQRSEWKNAN